MDKEIITGNWKMYKTIEEAVAFINQLKEKLGEKSAYLAVPFTAIQASSEAAKDSSITIGAQNMNDASEGAFTGEIAAKMLTNAGAKFVILGHSERRHLFGETSAFVNRKVHKALAEGLQPVLCVGETLDQHKEGKAKEIVKQQLEESLEGVEEIGNLILAYEPVWAIGTDEAATPEQAQEMHAFCRECLSEKWGEEAANQIVIQYGGSVKPGNAKALMDQKDINGLLIGGASLSADTFLNIVNYR